MRLTTCYRLARTNTFRLGSGKLFQKPKRKASEAGPEFGGNMQNWEKGLRRLALADEGYSFCQTDQSGADALIVAYLCPPGRFRDLFLYGIKPHVYIGVFFPEHWVKQFPCVTEFATIPIRDLPSHPQWPAFAKAVAASDENPSASRYYYLYKKTCHCVDDTTEVLTRTGWVLASKVHVGEEIAIWSAKTTQVKFEVPERWHRSHYTGDMVQLNNLELDQCVTPNHKVVYWSNGAHFNCEASKLFNRRSARIPLAGEYVGGSYNLDDASMRMLVAIQADGCIISKQNVRFRFKRYRKIVRLKSLLKALNLEHRITYTEEGVTDFSVDGLAYLIELFQGVKLWDSWLLNLSRHALEVFFAELTHWDGSDWSQEDSTTRRMAYYSTPSQNCHWVKTIAHLLGKQATVRWDTKCHKVGLNNRRNSRIESVKTVQYSGVVSCPTVSSGHFMIRRNGKISVTGNSGNYGIQKDTFVEAILADSGGKVVLSPQQGDNLLHRYRDVAFPELYAFHRLVESTLERTGELRNLFGYPRRFRSLKHDIKEAFAFIPQSTVGCITNLAVIAMDQYIYEHKLDWTILNNCHDSYLVQAPTPEIVECAKKMQEFINIEMTAPRGEKFRMRSASSIGKNWGSFYKRKYDGDVKEENLDGLVETKL